MKFPNTIDLHLTFLSQPFQISVLPIFLALFGLIPSSQADSIPSSDSTHSAATYESFEAFKSEYMAEKFNWSRAHDFDGDGIKDTLLYDYSDGAHCCYTFHIVFGGGKSKSVRIPFQMDGGYVGGVDLRRPDHFNVVPGNGTRLPMIFMEINTYNIDKYPIPAKWTRKYGIRTNYVCITTPHRILKVVDCPQPSSE